MEVKQVYELVNGAVAEAVGESAILNEDLTNVVDVGTAILNANAKDKYVDALINRIGKVIMVSRSWQGMYPNILMDGSEYGSVIQKISGEWPEAYENETWELKDGNTYNQDQFYQPKVEEKFFNSKTTFEVPVSITEEQLKQSFTSPEQLGTFVSMIYINVENAMTLRVDLLAQRTINNMIAETIFDDYQSVGLNTKSGIKAVNLLYLYNQKFGTDLAAEDALTNLDFLKFASYQIKRYVRIIQTPSKLFNIGNKLRFTPKDRLHAYLLSDFFELSSTYLQSDTYHNELVALPKFQSLAYFQGTGEDYAFNNVSSIDITTSTGHTVQASGILGVLFDRYALGVYNYNRRTTNHYNAKAEFWNNFYKSDASFFNDFNENMIVFFIA